MSGVYPYSLFRLSELTFVTTSAAGAVAIPIPPIRYPSLSVTLLPHCVWFSVPPFCDPAWSPASIKTLIFVVVAGISYRRAI